MSEPILISGIRFTPAPLGERAPNRIGWVSFILGDRIRVDGVVVRRARTGRLTLLFPWREDRGGRRHSLLQPVDAAARAQIEHEVLAAIETRLAAARAQGGDGAAEQEGGAS